MVGGCVVVYIEASVYVWRRGVEWRGIQQVGRRWGEDIVGSRRGTPTMLIQTDLVVDGVGGILEWRRMEM